MLKNIFFRCTYDMWYVDSNMHKLRLKGLICVWMEWKEKFKDAKDIIRSRISRGQTLLYNGQKKMAVVSKI